MGLPTPDLMGMRQVEAKYAHAVAMDRALLQQLKGSSGQPLLQHAVACEFWTLHSDRASLPSFAACLNEVPPEWIEDLGRWSKSMSATYVRTHLARVRSIQRWVAEAARHNARIDEEEHWSDFAAVFLMKHGISTEATVEQIVGLTRELSNARSAYRVTASIPELQETVQDDNPAELETQAPDENDAPAPLTPTHTVPDDTPSLGDFVVSLQRGFRRLHRMGDCHLVPGTDNKSFMNLGSERPSREHFDTACRLCFKSDQRTDLANSSSSEGSSS